MWKALNATASLKLVSVTILILSATGCGSLPDLPDLPLPEPPPEAPIPPPDVPVPEPPPISDVGIKASFLMRDATWRMMNVLSPHISDGEFVEMIRLAHESGDNAWFVYMSNWGDAGALVSERPILCFYRNNALGGEWDMAVVNLMRQRLQRIQEEGFAIIPWYFADDSSRFSRASVANQKQFIVDCHDLFAQFFTLYECLGLELNEHMDRSRIEELYRFLDRQTENPTGVHLTTGRINPFGLFNGRRYKTALDLKVHILFYQYGFGKSADRVRSETLDVVNRLPTDMIFVGAEYHKSSRSAEAKALGRAIWETGVTGGTGNGR